VLWSGLLLVISTLFLAFLLAQLRLRLFLGKPLPVYGTIAGFTLTNQLGQPVTLADLRGHVWVADIIFTRCAGPCLKMSRQMKDLQQKLPDPNVRLVSLTTDSDYDTPAVLKNYAERFNADPKRWLLLTGPKNEISNLATNSFKLSVTEKKPEERETPVDLFIHSTLFIVVDKAGVLRGVFESVGEGIDSEHARNQILAAVRRLERE